MKKTILFATFFCSFWITTKCQSFYSFSLSDIDNVGINLSSFQGSKTLIFIAPSRPEDSAQISIIDSFQTIYGNNIRFIGIMSYEDGYVDSNSATMKRLYHLKGAQILLTKGMYTRKVSGDKQSELIKWLTTKSINDRFNVDIKTTEYKFFINKVGELYAVEPYEMPLFSDRVIQNVKRKL